MAGMSENTSYPDAGFARLAGDFIRAAKPVAGEVDAVSGLRFLPVLFPFLFLIGHGLELAYKAVLLVDDATEKDLKQIGHDLVRCRREVQVSRPGVAGGLRRTRYRRDRRDDWAVLQSQSSRVSYGGTLFGIARRPKSGRNDHGRYRQEHRGMVAAKGAPEDVRRERRNLSGKRPQGPPRRLRPTSRPDLRGRMRRVWPCPLREHPGLSTRTGLEYSRNQMGRPPGLPQRTKVGETNIGHRRPS